MQNQKIKRRLVKPKLGRKPLLLVEASSQEAHLRPDIRVIRGKENVSPRRPAHWKPGERFVGKLSLQLAPVGGLRKGTKGSIRIASIHRPSKAGWMHFDRKSEISALDKKFIFEKMPAGDYIVAVQTPGFRPYAGIIRFTKRTPLHVIPFPLLRAPSPEHERDLLRMGERHPFSDSMRRYLIHYGYLRTEECQCPADEFCAHLSAALRHFQKTYRLEARGTLTLESFFLGLVPRCDVPDVRTSGPLASTAGPTGADAGDPIVFMGERWDTYNLLYNLQNGTNDISNEWDIIRGAMNHWHEASPLTFAETASAATSHLEYTFRRPGESGYPFDEEGSKHSNVLAHAWGPLNGTVEFDDSEDWGDTSLSAVATHETGHALGLAHCNIGDATMYPYYDSGQASLHETDVRGIKSLYATKISAGGPFIAVPIFGLQQMGGTDSITIDLGQVRHFLAWGSITMVDSLADFDRDNMYCIDIYEVDGTRTWTSVYGGAHFGSERSPANVFAGSYVGYGRRITFRISAGHVADLEVAGYALVLLLN
jgi:hypothetical protein